MKQGRDYLIFPLDVPSEAMARQWVERLKGHVGMFKIGLELFIKSGPALVEWAAGQSRAGIFLDLKLHDIPVTVQRAMACIANLPVELATVHCGESLSMLEAAVAGSEGKVKVLGVTVLTSVAASDLETAGYRDEMVSNLERLVLHKAGMAKAAGCAGIVCSGFEAAGIKAQMGRDFLTITPGVRPESEAGKKDDQRRVVTPAMAVNNGADYIVVGRPIRDAHDPIEAAVRIADEIDNRK